MEQIDELNKRLKLKSLTVQDIAEVIESWTKIPVKKITEAETQKLLNLEEKLTQKSRWTTISSRSSFKSYSS